MNEESDGKKMDDEQSVSASRVGHSLSDIAHLFLTGEKAAPSARPRRPQVECAVSPDWHRRQVDKINSVRRLLERLDIFLSPHVDVIHERVPKALAALPDKAPERENLVVVRQAAESLREVWQALRELRRRPPAGQATVDLHAILRQVLGLFPHLSGPSHIRLAVEFGTQQAMVDGRADLLETAVFHLIRNALESMQPGGGVLRLRTQVDEAGLELEVSDNGDGIPHDLLEHVAEPLVTTKAERGHVGMGLTTAIMVVDSLGGSVAMHSVPGEGTRVTVFLPPPSGAGDEA